MIASTGKPGYPKTDTSPPTALKTVNAGVNRPSSISQLMNTATMAGQEPEVPIPNVSNIALAADESGFTY